MYCHSSWLGSNSALEETFRTRIHRRTLQHLGTNQVGLAAIVHWDRMVMADTH